MSFASPSTTDSQDINITSSSDTGILSSFIYGITSYNITVPLWLQITVIIIIMILLFTGGYFAYDLFDVNYTRNGFMWFIFIAFLNLTTILAVLIYYNSNNSPTTYTGTQGRKGKKGQLGKVGTSVTCDYCKNNIYLQRIKNTNPIATLSTYTAEFQTINDNIAYFNKLIEQGNINYDSFVNSILLEKYVDPSQADSITRFRSLMTPSSIAIFLIENINANITKSSTRTYGTFKTPGNRLGFTRLGDSVYGGSENFALNSFMVNGDYMHPPSYTLLVSIPTYNETTGNSETYSIWRPNSQSVSVPGFKSQSDKSTSIPMVKTSYEGIGDVCRAGTIMPVLNDTAILNENCLDPVPSTDLTLIFIYVGNLKFNDESPDIDYTRTDSYLIQHNVIQNDIEILSVWRTPLNTFITNCNSQNVLINGTIAYNMVSMLNDSLTEYGAVSSKAKNNIRTILQSVNIPKILAATTLCKHYELELHKDLVYYFNKFMNSHKKELSTILSKFYKSNAKFSQVKNLATLGAYMKMLAELIKSVDGYNAKLIKDANINLKTGTNYDPSKEFHLPPYLLNAYNRTKTQLLTISVKIENTNTFLDLINYLFDNSIETRIATDSDGIAEGGVLLNEIQETVVRICKMVMPPSKQAYTIKDECLGTFALDRDREEVIREFTTAIGEYNKLTDEFSSDAKYDSVMPNVMQTEEQMFIRIGQLCGYIDNYMIKINKMQLDEFTTSRIKGLKKLYGDMVIFLNKVNSSV